MEWTVHPEITQLLQWLALMLGTFILGVLFERDRQRTIKDKNKQARLIKEIDTYVANQLRERMK